MRVFIAGSKGQLAHDCYSVLSDKHDVTGLDLPDIDITSADSIDNAIDKHKPDIVLNCAAYTNVDQAEVEQTLAREINEEGPRLLAQALARRSLPLLHISTDYVFDGTKNIPLPYHETDTPKPVTYYGISKLAGEEAISKELANYVILRTAWLYGEHGKNFLKTILTYCLRKPEQPLRIINDQYGSPTWSFGLANQIEKVITSPAQGIYHATGEGYCTWHDLASEFLIAMNIKHEIIPCSTSEYPTTAKRPQNSILENKRLKEANLNIMRDWKLDIYEFVKLSGDKLLTEIKDNEH